jgi:alpha-amylase
MEYTVIDDIHFKYAGLQQDQLYHYYVTEDLGYVIKLFPISQNLRYLIPFQKADKTIEFLRSIASTENRIAVFADDGEKFGLWPDTYEHVYAGGWLDDFFALLGENRDWIHMAHFSEVIDRQKPNGTVYLPTASYAEMLHWALPNKAFKAYEAFEHVLKESHLLDEFGVFVRGGFWRNFFTKYAESNNLHKKMMLVAEKIWKNKYGVSEKKLKKAKDHLWAGQCNCPYWHGVFGGLYLPHLRTAIYDNLIAAENIVDKPKWKNNTAVIEVIDFDKNGTDEVLVETEKQNIYISLLDGGTIFEHDLRAIDFNISDTMARREEGYHKKLLDMRSGQKQEAQEEPASIHDLVVAKEEGLEKKLFYDKYLPRKWRIHLFKEGTPDNFYRAEPKEISDVFSREFTMVSKKRFDNEVYLRLETETRISDGDKSGIFLIQKIIRIPVDGLGGEMEIVINRKSGDIAGFKLGIDHFYSMLAGDAGDRYYFSSEKELGNPRLNSMFTLENSRNLGLKDEWKGISVSLDLSSGADFWVYPVETISLSESGFERVYQASCVMPVIDVQLRENTFSFSVTEKIRLF